MCMSEATASNMAVKLSVRTVTSRACARPAPARPAAHGRRSTDLRAGMIAEASGL
jgi:hypothetical protein